MLQSLMLKPNLCIGHPSIQPGVIKYYFLGIKVEIKMCGSKTVFSQVDSAPSMYCDPRIVHSDSLCLICAHGELMPSSCLAHRLVALCRYFVAMRFETILKLVLHHFQGRKEYSSSLSHKDASQNSQLSSTGCHQFCQIVSFMTLQLKSHTSREWKVNGLGFGNDRTC